MARDFVEQFIIILSRLFIFAIFARVIMSWLRIGPRGPIFTFIYEVTEPVLAFFRRYIPPLGGVLDLSPIFAYLAIDIISSLLLRII
ncbi:hypothetical protein COV82_06650 [Candidatus Peregrinibacteria bacterium CG11_big_fil_rev_8_21_14_0_20_46_8]|nr:MAG: hypothetical protein COV82_06650 [Candidatus Peregrinibacteria bacterium CG11_big_fil_rev_8_21_14_0_20_46_8]